MFSLQSCYIPSAIASIVAALPLTLPASAGCGRTRPVLSPSSRTSTILSSSTFTDLMLVSSSLLFIKQTYGPFGRYPPSAMSSQRPALSTLPLRLVVRDCACSPPTADPIGQSQSCIASSLHIVVVLEQPAHHRRAVTPRDFAVESASR